MPERQPGSPPCPGSPLYELKEWVLDIRCGNCRSRTRLPVRLVAEQVGPKVGIMRVVIRLRCKKSLWPASRGICGGKPDYVALLLFEPHKKNPRETERIIVLGDVPNW